MHRDAHAGELVPLLALDFVQRRCTVAQRFAGRGLTVPGAVCRLGDRAAERDAPTLADPLPLSARPARRNVSPIARLDALDTATHPPLEQSL